jgi:hypothetical protein
MNNNSYTKENQNKLEDFLPYLYLDNPVFDELLRLTQEKNIIKKDTDDKNYLFQAKIMLYTNFNKYLNLLFLDLEDDKIIKLDKKIEKTTSLDKVLNILENNLNKNKKDILDKFFSFFA